jgi:hypothetical protein
VSKCYPSIAGRLISGYSNLPHDATCWIALALDQFYPVTWYNVQLGRGQVFIPGRQWSFVIALTPATYAALPLCRYDCGDEDY